MSDDLDILVPATEKVKTSKGVLTITLFGFIFFPVAVKFASKYSEQIATGKWMEVLSDEFAVNDLCAMITACSGRDRAFLDTLAASEVVKLFLKCFNLNLPFFVDVFKEEVQKMTSFIPKQMDTELRSLDLSEQGID